jgi:hypothetical protein
VPAALPSISMPLVQGWNDKCYIGAATDIEDALSPILDEVRAVYLLKPSQDFHRWFPGRADVSTLSQLLPFDQLFVLMSGPATWHQESAAGEAPSSLSLVEKWNSVCYTGQPKAVADATAAISGEFSVLYMLSATEGWIRYVPGNPDLSEIAQLQTYDSVVLLVIKPGGTQWVFDP